MNSLRQFPSVPIVQLSGSHFKKVRGQFILCGASVCMSLFGKVCVPQTDPSKYSGAFRTPDVLPYNCRFANILHLNTREKSFFFNGEHEN